MRQIGSLHHLAVFEAAARHLSFTRAAEALNVSQPAVSQSVRQLERAVGVALFQRRHRKIALTDAGALLLHDVGEGFSRLEATLDHLGRLAVTRHVTLSVSTAFANHWMVPRLQAFHARHPGIDLRLQTTDKELDLAGEGIALGMRRGTGAWPGYAAGLIADEHVVAVASPGWVARHGVPADPQALTSAALIHLEEPYRARPTWADWFAAAGLSWRDAGGGLRLNDYALVLQAAMAGEGVAMGYAHVIDRLLAQGLLVRLGPWSWATGLGHWLVWSDRTPLSENAEAVCSWMLAEASLQADSLAGSAGGSRPVDVVS
ncbi:MAG: LysR substrate-binding domain-containing protein [Pseudomonadota bacterium]